MDWLWTCLGGGKHGVQPPRICAGKSANSSTRGGRGRGGGGGGGSTWPHSLRLQHLAVPLPKNGHMSSDKAFQRQAVQSSYKCGEPEIGDMIKIPVSSLSTTSCTSINSLWKASEGRTGRSFLSDNESSSLRSDVDELKEELAALRHRLAAEEEEAKRLREEVNCLRSSGVLHKPEDCYQAQASKSLDGEALLPQDCNSLSIYDDAAELRKQQSRERSVKQSRRCFSGPLSWTGSSDETHCLSKDASLGSVAAAEAPDMQQQSHEKVSILRPVHSFKQQFDLHGIRDNQSIPLEKLEPTGEDGAAAQTLGSRMLSRSHASSLSHKISRPSSTWITHDQENSQVLHENGKVEKFTATANISESADIQWIEVRDGPCPSASSTNVKLCPTNPLKDNAKSPQKMLMPMQNAGGCGDTLPKDLQRTGKRQHRRSSHQEPIEKRAKDQLLKPAYHAAKLADSFEAQLLSAVKSFNQQRQGQLSLTSSSTNNVGSLFHTSRKRSTAFRSRGFCQPLSPVKESLSIEEASWSSRNEGEQVFRNQGMPCSLRVTVSDSKRNQSFEGSVNSPSLEKPEAETEKQLEGVFEEANHQAPSLKQPSRFTDKTHLKPVQCASPSSSPRKMSASSSAPDAVAALPASSETSLNAPVVEQEELLSSVEGRLVDNDLASDDEGEVGMKPTKCASPTFTPKKKPSRSAVYQATEFKRHELPSLLNSTDSVGRNHECVPKSMDQAASLPSSAPDSPHWTSSHENIDFHPNSDRSWHADAVKEINSTHDARSITQQQPCSLLPKEKVPMTVKQRQQNAKPSPPQANSGEKKVVKGGFLSYVYDTDEQQQMKDSVQKECATKKQQEQEMEQQQQQSPIEEVDTTPTTSLVMSRVQYWNSVHKSASSDERMSSDSKRGGWKREGKEIRTDSGETNSVSTTFSIDLGSSENSPINYESFSEVECSADRYHVSSLSAQQPLSLDADLDATVKEDAISRSCRDPQIPSMKHSSVSQQQSAPSSGSRKCNNMLLQNNSPKDRPILGAVAAAHWENVLAQSPLHLWDGKGEPNLTHKYKEDQKVKWHGTPFEVRVDRALANQSDVSPRALFGVNTNPLVRSSLEMR